MSDTDLRAALERHWKAFDANDFDAGEVVRETQYFGEPFEPGPSRAQWVEKIVHPGQA